MQPMKGRTLVTIDLSESDIIAIVKNYARNKGLRVKDFQIGERSESGSNRKEVRCMVQAEGPIMGMLGGRDHDE